MPKSIVTSHRNFILVATSAGSGKTELLARRFVYLLLRYLTDPNDLRTFLAITFTREAAREMKKRILKVLRELKSGDFSSYDEFLGVFDNDTLRLKAEEVFWTLLENYPRIQVSTIDSFVEKLRLLILLELELLPNIELEKTVDEDMLNLALESVLSDKKNFEEALSIALGLAEESSSFEWDILNKLTECIMDLKDKQDHSLAVIEPLFTYNFNNDSGKLTLGKELAEAYNNSFSNIRKFFNEGDSFEDYFRLIGQRVDDLNKTREGGTKKNSNKGKSDYLSEYDNFVKAIRNSSILTDELVTGFLQYYAPYNRIYDGAAHFYSSIFMKNYNEILNKMRKMSISDVNRTVAEYLRSPEKCSSKMMSFILKYRHILIDEFQDTDPLQWDIMLSFIREALSGNGTVFLVGDVKQAIYLFRNADYKIMHSLMIGEGASRFDLNQNPDISEGSGRNFRSRENIVKFVNEVVFDEKKFSDFLRECLRDIIFKCEQVHNRESRLENEIKRCISIWVPITQQASPENSGGYVRNIKLEKNKSDSELSYLDEAYSTIEEQIKFVCDRGYTLGDIAILTNKNEYVRGISTRLMDSGYEVVSFSSLNVVSQAVIQELISLLSALYNEDLLSALVFLTGRIFSSITQKREDVLLKDLYTERALNGKIDVVRFVKTHSNIDLSAIKNDINLKPLYQLLLELVNLLNLQNTEYIGPVTRFLDFIFKIESSQGSITVDKLTKLLDNFLSEKEPPEELQVPLPGNVDAIKVMTFHKAKGLEFPVVINLFTSSPGARNKNIYFLRTEVNGNTVIQPFKIKQDYLKPLVSGLFDPSLFDPSLSDPSLFDSSLFDSSLSDSKNLIKLLDAYAQDQIDEMVQDINLTYVALTRAKDILINIYFEGTIVDRLFSKVGAPSEYGSFDIRSTPKSDTYGVDTRVPSLVKRDKIILRPEKEYEIASGNVLHEVQSSLLGDVIHEFLQRISFINVPSDLDNYSRLLEIILKKYGLSAEKTTEVLEMLKSFFAKEENLKFYMHSSDEQVMKEKEVILPDGSFLRIDRLVVGPKLVKVIDFKTGSAKAEDKKQMENYKNVVKAVFPDKEIRGFILYINSGEVVEV